MVTNKKMTIDVDGEDKTYYFKKDGSAYMNTVVSSSLYGYNGALVDEFGDGSTYAVVPVAAVLLEGEDLIEKGHGVINTAAVEVEEKRGTETYKYDAAYILLNGNGKIKKNGTVTDMDGDKVTVKNYMVVKIEDKN